jgi:hypothetical protein
MMGGQQTGKIALTSIKLPSPIRVMRSKGHVARMADRRNAYSILAGNQKQGVHLGYISRNGWIPRKGSDPNNQKYLSGERVSCLRSY